MTNEATHAILSAEIMSFKAVYFMLTTFCFLNLYGVKTSISYIWQSETQISIVFGLNYTYETAIPNQLQLTWPEISTVFSVGQN